jgi:DNA polymerase-3 subunit delta'
VIENFLADLIGQEQAVTLLEQAFSSHKIAPAYLFVGIPGIGKSIAARGFAQLLLDCERRSLSNHPDLMWVEPTYSHQGNLIKASLAEDDRRKTAPKIRIEQIRQITQFFNRQPLKSDRLIAVIEDAHLMSEAPANALLKTLEEPGNGTIILIAPSVDSLLTTIVSRCQCIRFTPLSDENLQQVLKKTNYSEILANPSLITMAQGSPGSAIAAAEKLQLIPDSLHQQLLQTPQNYLEVFTIAKAITQELELPTQLWLVDYLQHYYWQQSRDFLLANQWEKTRQYLLSYVQPRLVWESIFLAISSSNL